MKKRWIAAALAATMAISLTACGGAGEEKKAESAKKESDKELTVWVEKVFSDDANTAMQERLDAFAEESGIKVKYEFIGATDFMTKLNAAIEAGSNVPDITTSAVTKVVNYYPNIPYKDVSDIVNNINKERPYFEAVYEGTKIDGKHYFVPMTSSSTMMFVRKDKLEEKGITELPKTWDEVFEVAEQISDPDNGFYGLGIGCGPTDEDGENMFRMINWDQGGYIFDKDGNITLDNDVTKNLLTKYKEMYDGGVIPKAASTWDPGGNNSAYLMGECGIVFNAPTLYNALQSDEANKELFENTEMVSLPSGSDNDTTMGFATGFAIMETCDDVESATKLIEYMYDKEWYEEYLEITAPVFAPLFQDMEGEGIEEGLCGRTTVFEDPLNEGMSGLSYLAPCMMSHSPLDFMVVMLGTNDCKARFALTPRNIACGMKRFLIKAQQVPAWRETPRILLIAPGPIAPECETSFVGKEMGICSGRSKEVAKEYRKIADELQVDFLDAGDFVKMNTLDYMHLDKNSHGILGQKIGEYIKNKEK